MKSFLASECWFGDTTNPTPVVAFVKFARFWAQFGLARGATASLPASFPHFPAQPRDALRPAKNPQKSRKNPFSETMY